MFFSLIALFVFSDPKILTISSKDFEELDSPSWAVSSSFDDHSAFLLISAPINRFQGMTIFRYMNKSWIKALETSQRENVYYPDSSIYDSTKKLLYIKDMLQPFIITLSLQNETKRLLKVEAAQNMFRLEGKYYYTGRNSDTIVIGAFDSSLPAGLQKMHPSLEKLLPYSADKPTSLDSLYLVPLGSHIFALSTLSDSMHQFDSKSGKLLKSVPIKTVFPTYVPMPKSAKDTSVDQKTSDHFWFDWLSSGHDLLRVDTHKGHLYGFFVLQQDEHGIWVRLDEKGYQWDNHNKVKILAMSDNKVLLASTTIDADENLEWEIWIADQLPESK